MKNLLFAFLLILAGFSFASANGRLLITGPEDRVRSFYVWYLTAMNNQKDPTKSKTVMLSHLSARFGRWYYSKAGQHLDYDIFVNGQDWNKEWATHVTVGKAAIKGTTAQIKVKLGSAAGDWDMNLQVSLVKEGGTWRIDRVKGLYPDKN